MVLEQNCPKQETLTFPSASLKHVIDLSAASSPGTNSCTISSRSYTLAFRLSKIPASSSGVSTLKTFFLPSNSA